jgi:hypothetical protein
MTNRGEPRAQKKAVRHSTLNSSPAGQAEEEAGAERDQHGLERVLADVILAILLKRAHACAGVVVGMARLFAILAGGGAGGIAPFVGFGFGGFAQLARLGFGGVAQLFGGGFGVGLVDSRGDFGVGFSSFIAADGDGGWTAL